MRCYCEELVHLLGYLVGSPLTSLRCLALLLQLLTFGNINSRANIALKRSVLREAWDTAIDQPAILPVEAAQPVFHCEALARLEGRQVRLQTAHVIVWMDSLRPTIA